MLRDEIFRSIAARKIEGYRGAELFEALITRMEAARHYRVAIDE